MVNQMEPASLFGCLNQHHPNQSSGIFLGVTGWGTAKPHEKQPTNQEIRLGMPSCAALKDQDIRETLIQ
eukprot:scaffold1170_cov122-Cylindrotheca_fusiformis.AAC.27